MDETESEEDPDDVEEYYDDAFQMDAAAHATIRLAIVASFLFLLAACCFNCCAERLFKLKMAEAGYEEQYNRVAGEKLWVKVRTERSEK